MPSLFLKKNIMTKIFSKKLGYINRTKENLELVQKEINDTSSKKRTKADSADTKRVSKSNDGEKLAD